jgi:hypothetical protein
VVRQLLTETMLLAAIASAGGIVLDALDADGAWQGTNVALISAMKQGGPCGPKAKRTRVVFVTVQVALAVALLSGSGLLVRALQAAYAVRLGFETEGLVLASVDPPPDDHPAHRDLAIRMQAELVQQPDLLHASVGAQAPLQGGGALVARSPGFPHPKKATLTRASRSLRTRSVPAISRRWVWRFAPDAALTRGIRSGPSR